MLIPILKNRLTQLLFFPDEMLSLYRALKKYLFYGKLFYVKKKSRGLKSKTHVILVSTSSTRQSNLL